MDIDSAAAEAAFAIHQVIAPQSDEALVEARGQTPVLDNGVEVLAHLDRLAALPGDGGRVLGRAFVGGGSFVLEGSW